MTASTSAGPLAGVAVLDLTQILAGPMCTMVLADMGADVIKVEKPNGGDDNRRMGPPFVKDWSAGFLAVNRNQRSLALDLQNEEGRKVFKRLVEGADVVVENFRPGVMERLGLAYEELRKIKPALVYCTISGFGSTGPARNRGGFDLVAQGVSGLMSITGHPNSPPAKVGVPITDLTAGLYGANGIMAAYIHALRTGEGQMVDTSLMEAGVAYTVWESSVYFAEGEIPGPLGSAHRVSAPYQALRTRNGYLNLGAATQPTWEQLCRAIGLEDLMEDDRFRNPWDRKAREEELAALLEETFSTDDTERWLELLDGAGVVAGPIYNMEQVYQDPQVLAREMLVEMEDPDLGTIRNIGVPVKLSETPGSIRRRAPALGEHSAEILLEWGFGQNEVDGLLADGVILANQGSGSRR
ncbi:Succinate--hydroxymethylglutarate CoA-transferase [Geodia barretti]|uniref:Succinate--hydroxymethylglutarate CoA-transferase n=1 Tax=Geodia barretti TaxID=519541 RepID=A0AA35T1Z5_GEOBA|nr:Succinate--hydroxymethylglutarate CoA-transferase [Geodia barretti]